MSQREIKSFDPRWAVLSLIGAVAIVAAFFAANTHDQGVTPQVTGRVNSTSFATDLSQGPISGMPEGTFRALTQAPAVIHTLADGPVPGMPEGTYRDLTRAEFAIPDPSVGPVPGMPNGTYELVRTLSAR